MLNCCIRRRKKNMEKKLFCILCVYILVCFSKGVVGQDIVLPFKAVNLGAWLVTEGWMTPSLFDQIPINKDLLDGTQVQLKSLLFNKYLAAENGGGAILVANRTNPSGWETFRLWRINGTSFNLRVFNKQFIGQREDRIVVAQSSSPGPFETFQIVRNQNDPTKIRLRAFNGLFLQAESETSVVADYPDNEDWGDQNPSVFKMTIVNTLQGEYQLTNALGDKAAQVMQDHWSSYIVEEDFKFMSTNGLNAVRIPVGWWIKYDQTPPPFPFVAGSVQALDNAFSWAEKYNMKVILDLHAVENSQNGNDHSGARDGYAEWGDSDITSTVQVIEFLAQRYAKRRSLGAIELMNEPSAGSISLDTISKYYKAGYDAVRRHTSTAYVIFSNRLGSSNTELLPLAGSLDRTVIDVHYYNLFSDSFNSLDAQGNIDYINNQRSAELQQVTPSNGPLSFVGEWTGEWTVSNAGIEDYQRYANAQMKVYGKATFGWAYWSYKCAQNHWSLKWMIENNFINLRS